MKNNFEESYSENEEDISESIDSHLKKRKKTKNNNFFKKSWESS